MDHLLKAAIDLMGAHTADAQHLMPGKREYLYYNKNFDLLLNIDITLDHALWEVTGYPTGQRAPVVFAAGNMSAPFGVHHFDAHYLSQLPVILSEMGQCRPRR